MARDSHVSRTKPDLMLVDEPVAGLTDEETDLTADLLKSYQEKIQ